MDASADGSMVTGTYYGQWLGNDPAGMPMLDVRPFAIAATAILDDGTTSAITADDDGTFAFMRRDAQQGYRLVVEDVSLDGVVEVQLATPHLDLGFVNPERYGASLASAGTSLTIDFVSIPTPAFFKVLTTGVLSSFNIDETDPEVAPWEGRSLVSAANLDRAYVVNYVATGPSTSAARSRCELAATELTDGANTTKTCSFVTLTADHQAVLRGKRATTQARLKAAIGPAFTPSLVVLGVYGATPQTTGTHRPYGGADGIVGSASVSDDDVAVGYAAVLPGLVPTGIHYTSFTRTVMVGSTSVVLTASTRFAAPAAAAQAITALVPSVEIAGGFELDGIALADGQAFAIPASGAFELTWTPAAEGAADRRIIHVTELDPDGVAPRTVRTVIVLGRRAILDASVFTPGKAYYLTVATQVDAPGAATGDMRHTEYDAARPYQASEIPSPWFTITPQ